MSLQDCCVRNLQGQFMLLQTECEYVSTAISVLVEIVAIKTKENWSRGIQFVTNQFVLFISLFLDRKKLVKSVEKARNINLKCLRFVKQNNPILCNLSEFVSLIPK